MNSPKYFTTSVCSSDLTGRRWHEPRRSSLQATRKPTPLVEDHFPDYAPDGQAFKIYDDDGNLALQFRSRAIAEKYSAILMGAEIVYGPADPERGFTDEE